MTSSDTQQEVSLAGQVAIVTGGGRGIGRELALALAGAGAAVAVVARSEDQLAETVSLIEEAGGRAISLQADVTDQQAIEQMLSEVERQLGPVDLLVNNAGVLGPVGPLWENDADEWWRCMDINVRGSLLCTKAVLPGMISRRRGRIVSVSSGAGNSAGRHMVAYTTSKTALTRLMEGVANETRDHGISAFAICPGFVPTFMTESLAQSPADTKWRGGAGTRRMAGGRDHSPQRLAELMLYLASGRADALSGCFFHPYYDPAEMMLRAEEIQRDELYKLRLRE